MRRSREKKAGVPDGDRAFVRCLLQVERSRIAGIRFLLEAYDGIGYIRTLDPLPALVEFRYPPSQKVLALQLLEVLRRDFGAERVPAPSGVRR